MGSFVMGGRRRLPSKGALDMGVGLRREGGAKRERYTVAGVQLKQANAVRRQRSADSARTTAFLPICVSIGNEVVGRQLAAERWSLREFCSALDGKSGAAILSHAPLLSTHRLPCSGRLCARSREMGLGAAVGCSRSGRRAADAPRRG